MKQWPHAPVHKLDEAGAYCVTAGTHNKAHHFATRERLDFLEESLLDLARQYDWRLQAWAVFSNHYHFIAIARNPASLPKFMRHLHATTARFVNASDGAANRRVWFQYWDTHLTFERSYLARLAYVHTNPVKHGLTAKASDYRWCSAAWFENTAPPSFRQTVYSFKTDRVNVSDPYDTQFPLD